MRLLQEAAGKRWEREHDIRKRNWEDLGGRAWVADPTAWLDVDGNEKPLEEIDLSDVLEQPERLLMTLEESLVEFPDSPVNIELKDSFSRDDLKDLVALLDRHRNQRIILVVCLNPIMIEAFRHQCDERQPTGFSLLGAGAAWLGEFLPFNPFPHMKHGRALQTTYHPRFTPPGLIREVQARNGAVHVFLTAFTKLAPAIDAAPERPKREELSEILDRGVDGVMTDRPAWVRGLIDAWRNRGTP